VSSVEAEERNANFEEVVDAGGKVWRNELSIKKQSDERKNDWGKTRGYFMVTERGTLARRKREGVYMITGEG